MTVALTIQVKKAFFDREAVIKRVDRARRSSLSRVGGFTRTTAKRSIRKRKRSSLAGQPPSSHSGELKGGIFFSFDQRTDSVVVGPVPFSGSNVPEVLERGGRPRVRVTKPGGRISPKRITYVKPRPYMVPALTKTSARIPDAFAAAMRR